MELRVVVKKVLVMLLGVCMICVLTTCDNPPDGSIFASLGETLQHRLEANENIANGLYNSGLLPEEAKNRVMNGIKHTSESLEKNLQKQGTIDKKTCITFSKAIVYTSLGAEWDNGSSTVENDNVCQVGTGWHIHTPETGTDDCKPYGNNSAKYLSSYIYWAQENNDKAKAYFTIPSALESGTNIVEPIRLIDDDILNGEGGLKERLSYPIYVLSMNENYDLAKIHAAVAAAESADDVTQYLSGYFSKVTDKNGKEVTLLDINNPDNQIIRASRGNRYINDETQEIAKEGKVSLGNFYPTSSLGNKSWEGNTTIVSTDLKVTSNIPWTDICLPNCLTEQPGNDMGFYQNGLLIAKVRLYEFNQKAYEKISRQLSLSDDTWFITSSSNGGAAYLMQYPVGYVSGFEMTGDSGEREYNAVVKLSQLQLNIKTGAIVKQDGIRAYLDGKIIEPTNGIPQETSTVDQIYKLSDGKPGSSSFAIYGETGVDTGITDKSELGGSIWNAVYGEVSEENGVESVPQPINLPRIVLLDYLEVSYSPNVNSDGVVCYGRMIRLNHEALRGKLTDRKIRIAYYLDSSGKSLDEAKSEQSSKWLYLDDLCDIELLSRQFNGSSRRTEGSQRTSRASIVARLPSVKSEGYTNSGGGLSDELKNKQLEGTYIEKIESLPHAVVNSITTTTRFPGDTIARGDVSRVFDTDIPLMYAMAVGKPFGETGLVSWITSKSEKDSTTWWNSWLKKRGYTYNVPQTALSQYLKDNYSYELAESGLVILDLETIAMIQEDMNQEAKIDRMQAIRTWFKILGYCLIAYSVIILACWAMDVNVDLGVNALGKVTFGHLVAVSSTAEIPKESEDGLKYVGFQEIMVQSIKIAVIGAVIVFVDIVTIIIKLIDYFGGLAEEIGGMFGE